MNKKLAHTVTLAALLALGAAPGVLAMNHGGMDHSKMDHSKMGHGTGAQPAASVDIRKVVVQGYTLTYTLIDTKMMMAASAAPMTHDMSKVKSHHLMVNPVGADGKAVASGKAGFLVVGPDKAEIKVMAMLMEGGFGADLDLVAKGEYKITTKIALGDSTLVDEFVYPVK